MSRRRPKPGLLEIAVLAAAVAEATGGAVLQNVATDRIRTDMKAMKLDLGNRVGNAALWVILAKLLHTEANKASINPALGPVRML